LEPSFSGEASFLALLEHVEKQPRNLGRPLTVQKQPAQ